MKKLKNILLINWLYFSKELIEVGDVNFLTGKNGAGKSTVIGNQYMKTFLARKNHFSPSDLLRPMWQKDEKIIHAAWIL